MTNGVYGESTRTCQDVPDECRHPARANNPICITHFIFLSVRTIQITVSNPPRVKNTVDLLVGLSCLNSFRPICPRWCSCLHLHHQIARQFRQRCSVYCRACSFSDEGRMSVFEIGILLRNSNVCCPLETLHQATFLRLLLKLVSGKLLDASAGASCQGKN